MSDSLADRLAAQQVLFAASPSRAALRGLTPSWPLQPLSLRIHRNHAVEAALTVAEPYLQFAGFAPEWRLGDYDDSLSFPDDRPADVEIVWLDLTRYANRMTPAELGGWLGGRLTALRTQSEAPILVLDWDGAPEQYEAFTEALQAAISGLRGVHIADRHDGTFTLPEGFFDLDRERLTGTRMSAAGALWTARRFGHWIPALLRPRLKAVVVDLDNTLYAGVLGEDGADGLQLTREHGQLQEQLARLRQSGLFLGLLSRNDRDQVEELFATRGDLRLGLDDFDAAEISWAPKSAGLRAIATALRIDPSAILFVDDNPGELLETAIGVPGVHLLLASEADPAATVRALSSYPGIFSFGVSEEDGLRAADLRANEQREQALARSEADPAAYFRELGVTLTIGHDQADQLARIADMAAKTNQFNLALARYGAADIERFIADTQWQVSSARLEDRLSDSGVIATLLARRDGTTLSVEELCISCRAMGRRLEDLIVAQMLSSGPLFAGTERIRFTVAEGPRNQPARSWLAAFTNGSNPEVDATAVRRAGINSDVQIEVQR